MINETTPMFTKYLYEPSLSQQSNIQAQAPFPYIPLETSLVKPSNELELASNDQTGQKLTQTVSQIDQVQLDSPNIKVFCSECARQLTKNIFVYGKNAGFSHPTCVGCLAKTPEKLMNNNEASYQVASKLEYALFESTWSAYNEYLLLFSLQKWGFGNWKQIRQYMQFFGVKFSQDQIQTHYNTFYLADSTFEPKFPQNLIERKKDSSYTHAKANGQVQVSIATTNRTDLANYRFDPFEHIDDFSNHSDSAQQNRMQLQDQITRLKGYNIKRQQFQVNFDDSAEKIIANLEFRDDDLPQQSAVKYRLLEQYNQRLSKRNQIQKFTIQHKLLDQKHQLETEETRTQYEKEAANELKSFMRFCTFQQHNELVKRTAMAKQLKSIIEGMRTIRKDNNLIKLKEMYNRLKKDQNYSEKPKKRGRPSKVDHLNKKGEVIKGTGNIGKSQEDLISKIGLSQYSLNQILTETKDLKSGDKIKYKNYEVSVIDKS